MADVEDAWPNIELLRCSRHLQDPPKYSRNMVLKLDLSESTKLFAIGFLVVLYNRRPDESETLVSMIKNFEAVSGYKVHVQLHNNGPKPVDMNGSHAVAALSARGVTVECSESLSNSPLSALYNDFIDRHLYDRYVLLDQDSGITSDFLSALERRRGYEVIIPLISSHGEIRSPTENDSVVAAAGPLASDGVMGIGSGLALSREYTQKMKAAYGNVFDEKYALYGVDSTFFVRLQRIGRTSKVSIYVDGLIHHSLSRLEDESRDVKLFRAAERSYALGVTLRRYPEWALLKYCLRLFSDIARGKSLMSFSKIWRGFARGRHPRCR